MQAAAKLGVSITISQIGSDLPTTGTASVSSTDRTKEWQQTLTLDEDGVMHQVRATLLQYINASTCKLVFNYYHISFIILLEGFGMHCSLFDVILPIICSPAASSKSPTNPTAEFTGPYYAGVCRCDR